MIPPATPDAPVAETADKTIKITAVNRSTSMPKVWAAAIVKIEIVTAAPAILIVAPKGIRTHTCLCLALTFLLMPYLLEC